MESANGTVTSTPENSRQQQDPHPPTTEKTKQSVTRNVRRSSLRENQFYAAIDSSKTKEDEEKGADNNYSKTITNTTEANDSHYDQIEDKKYGKDSDSKSVHFKDEEEEASTEVELVGDGIPRPDTSTTFSDTFSEAQETDKETEEVFSTQVDEETLAAAQQRQAEQGNLFKTEEWGPSRPPSVSLHQIVNNKVNEHFKSGLCHMELQNYEKAALSFTKAINLRPNQTVFYVNRGECYLQLCDFQSAILNYKKACVLEPSNFKIYSRLAFVYFFQGQCLFDHKLFPEALESFSRAAEIRPEVTGYHIRSMACLAALERHGECLALVNKRLEAETDNADLYIMRARLHDLFHNTTLCYYDVKDALALEPDHKEAQQMMENLKLQAKEMKQQATTLNLVHRQRDALQKISLAIETDPSQPDYHITRGALQRRIGDYNAAIDDYLLAMDKTDHDEESPVYAEAQRQLLLTYNDFAVECFTKGFYEEAVILLNKAIKGEKDEKGLYINRGDCFFRQGHFQFALADYQQALELDVQDNAIHCRIAVIHNEYGVQDYQDKNYQDAESRFSLAIQHNPKMAQYYISRCRARQLMENISGARQDLVTAMQLDPSSEEITSLLARLFSGKTVKDVMRSELALSTRNALQDLVTESSRVSQTTKHTKKSSDNDASEQGSNQPKVVSTVWKPGHTFPSLKACMMEKDFYVKVASGKRQINEQVKSRLHNRKSLGQEGSTKILPLTEPVPYAQVGGHTFKQSNLAVNAVNGAGSGQKSPGWKKFSLGITPGGSI